MVLGLWSRLLTARSGNGTTRKARRTVTRFRPCLESLEDRRVPSHAPNNIVFVDDDNTGVEDGTQVNPFNTIQEAIAHAEPGETVFIMNGLYLESVTVPKPLTILGESRSGVVLAPPAEDENLDSAFGGVAQQGFLVTANNVTIRTLTINGQANPALTPGKNNFRNGIITPDDNMTDLGLVFTDLTVLNIFRRGIQISFDGGGNAITNNLIVQNSGALAEGSASIGVFGPPEGAGVPLGPTNIAGNELTNTFNWGIVENFGALLVIQANTITNTFIGMNLAALAPGSLVGGPAVADANNISVSGTGIPTGIQLTFSTGEVTVQGNVITAPGDGAGIWIFYTDETPVRILRNVISATTASSPAGALGSATGILVTDDETFFNEPDLPRPINAILQGNVIDNFARGIDILRSSATPNPIGVDIDGNTVSVPNAAGSFGIRLRDENGTGNVRAAVLCNRVDLSADMTTAVIVDGAGFASVSGNVLDGFNMAGIGVLLANTFPTAAQVDIFGNVIRDFAIGVDSDANIDFDLIFNAFINNLVAIDHTGTGTVDAEFNFFGTATGPMHPSNPGGTGQPVVDPANRVDVLPFATTAEVADQARFIVNLYDDVLNRTPDDPGLRSWVAFLQAGGTRLEAAAAFWTSVEHRSLQVAQFYQVFLNRAPDPAGRMFWVNQFQLGATEQQVMLAFLTSAEYQAQNPTPEAFVTALYQDVLNRTPAPAEVAFWVQQLQAGATRAEVALAFLTSEEEFAQVVRDYYVTFFDRSVDPLGLAFWTAALRNGPLNRTTLAITLLTSAEYFVKCSFPVVAGGGG